MGAVNDTVLNVSTNNVITKGELSPETMSVSGEIGDAIGVLTQVLGNDFGRNVDSRLNVSEEVRARLTTARDSLNRTFISLTMGMISNEVAEDRLNILEPVISEATQLLNPVASDELAETSLDEVSE